VRREAGALVQLQDGAASAYMRVVDSAVLSIVTGSEPVDRNTVPELMDMDVVRFATAQGEYARIVDRAVLLVLVGQALHNDRDVPPAKKQSVFAAIAVEDDNFASIVDSVGALVLDAGMTVAAKERLVQSIHSAVHDKQHRVRQLM
jgi:hypothetical protein